MKEHEHKEATALIKWRDQHRVEELQAQLKKYGWHVAGCPAFDATTCDVCDCGFEQALEQKP